MKNMPPQKQRRRYFMKRAFINLLLMVSLVTFAGNSEAAGPVVTSEIVPGIPVQNTVTMVDLGAKTCVPCKLMAPILEELKAEYKGRAEIIFIDVWDQANNGKAKAFKIMAIPTQIFYDKHGKETFRHLGFFSKKAIIKKLEELLKQS
jgi:thioredoxin 1